MGPANQNFAILPPIITNNKYAKTLRSTSNGLKVHGTNNLTFAILSCGHTTDFKYVKTLGQLASMEIHLWLKHDGFCTDHF